MKDKTLEHFATFFRDRLARAVMLDRTAPATGRDTAHICEAIEWMEACKNGLSKQQIEDFEKVCPSPRDAREDFYSDLANGGAR